MDPETQLLAEQVTLGALMLAPTDVDGVRPWLRAEDFTDWWHGQVYGALLERRSADLPIDVERVAEAMVKRLGERSGGRLCLFDLVEAVPVHAQAPVYARMVTESGLRREIAGTGVLLKAGALQSVQAGESGPLNAACMLVDAGLQSAAQRWAAATGSTEPVGVIPIPLRPALRNLELRSGADKYVAAHPGRDLEREHANLVTLIGTLIARPEHLPEVAAWLRPAQVPDPAWRSVYATAIGLAERGEPVDLVTVAWSGQRLAHHGAKPPNLRDLRDAVHTGWLTHPFTAARVVAGDQARALAERVADQLLAAAENPALEIGELLDTGFLLTSALRHAAQGLPAGERCAAMRSAVAPPDTARGQVAE